MTMDMNIKDSDKSFCGGKKKHLILFNPTLPKLI